MSSYQIYPPIGVARVGDAPNAFYVGPESYRGLPIRPDGGAFTPADLRDADGRLSRQAARFTIYRDTPAGPEEVTLDCADVRSIEWTVHVANKKASWYAFQTNAGENGYASNHPLRNAHVTDRHSLVIDAGPRQIAGRGVAGPSFSRDTIPPGYQGASFPPQPLYNGLGEVSIDTLGELRTDAQGRLLFLGGHGTSGCSQPQPSIAEYANNDNWWDDTADGPVRAVVWLTSGECIDAGSAWAIVAPPAYAPEIANLVTLWDTIFDTGVRNGQHPAICTGGIWRSGADGYRPNFQTEIGPLIERAALYPWVAAIPPRAHTFDMARLGRVPEPSGDDENRGLRHWILQVLRPPSAENQIIGSTGRTMMPFLAGDNALNLDSLSAKYLRLTDTQYFFLQQWAEGWFINEPDAAPAPLALSRGVLENCVGGAFSPGIEMSWISRNPAIYQPQDPLRIRAAPPTTGPLRLDFNPTAMEPGDICRYMAVPWQADFNECSSQPMDGRVLWWWPAQRPEFVYLDPRQAGPRTAAAIPEPSLATGGQVAWLGTDFDQQRGDYIMFADDIQMVQYWAGLGFVLRQTVTPDGEERYVEVARTLPRPFFPPSAP